jgi:hypothetical protein
MRFVLAPPGAFDDMSDTNARFPDRLSISPGPDVLVGEFIVHRCAGDDQIEPWEQLGQSLTIAADWHGQAAEVLAGKHRRIRSGTLFRV